MFLKEKTKEQFGYYPEDLKPTSGKLVCVACDDCGVESIRKKFNIKNLNVQTCGPCSIKRSTKATKANIVEILEKRKQTCLREHGVFHNSQRPEIAAKMSAGIKASAPIQQAKIKATNLARYGCTSPFNNPNVIAKIKATNLERYGAENVSNSKEIQEKRTQTFVERFGGVNPHCDINVREKRRQTCLEKYGVSHGGMIPAAIEARKKTNIERYGSPYALGNDKVQEKARQTRIERYGSPFSHTHCGKAQKEIIEWVNSFGFNFKSNHTILDGKEIDMYDESLDLGIEYCGLFWHTELSPSPRDCNYHNDKRLKCEEKGIRLITIFEDEWLHKENQCKSFIKALLRKNSIKLGARDCVVRTIDKQQANEFIDKYHIQGSNNLGLYFAGLLHDGNLVAVMSFGRHPRDSEKITLDRLCFKEDVFVTGGTSRLFKFLVKETGVKEIISWSDNRWSQGQVYKSLGFKLDTELAPDYSYVEMNGDTKKRLSKQSQKKNEETPEGMTERKWCLEKGLARIWDCGKKRWKWTA